MSPMYHGFGRDPIEGYIPSTGIKELAHVKSKGFRTLTGHFIDNDTWLDGVYIFGHEVMHSYLDSLTNHIMDVRAFAVEYFPGVRYLTDLHDASKFTREEFLPYAWYWHSARDVDVENWTKLYNAAWERHYKMNPHHWNFWDYHGNGRPAVMPIDYVKEMLCDWHGAAHAYTGKWDISPWMNEAYDSASLHNETRNTVWSMLRGLGYSKIDNTYVLGEPLECTPLR